MLCVAYVFSIFDMQSYIAIFATAYPQLPKTYPIQTMSYRYIECEAFTNIIDKKDCAYHKKLGWSTTDWHTHNRGQLIYAEYGVMRLYVGDNVYYIPSWHAAWIPQGAVHRVITESQDIMFYTLYLDHTGLSHPFYNTVSIFPMNNMLREMITYTKKWQLTGIPDEQETHFLFTIKYLLPDYATTKLLLHVPIPTDEKLLGITAFTQEHLQDKITTKDLTQRFGLSERSMHRLFLKELHMSFGQYHKLMRIVKAVELLSVPGKNVSEVAYEVGYESVPSFNKSFKEIIGEAPTKLYRSN